MIRETGRERIEKVSTDDREITERERERDGSDLEKVRGTHQESKNWSFFVQAVEKIIKRQLCFDWDGQQLELIELMRAKRAETKKIPKQKRPAEDKKKDVQQESGEKKKRKRRKRL
jgi:hypothetical protein